MNNDSQSNTQTHDQNINDFELSLPIDQLASPILGIIVVEFLGKS